MGPALQERVRFGPPPHRMQPLLRLPPLNNLRETSRLPVHRLCHFLPSPSLTLSTKETFQINVFSSLKTFSQTFRSGKGDVSSGTGQAHAGTERCEKERKKSQTPPTEWTDSVQDPSPGPSSEDQEISLSEKQNQRMKIICSYLFCKGTGELDFLHPLS